MHRIGTSIALVTGFIYMNLIATVWLFISMIPSEVILTIFIWPNWNTHFLDCLATTWNISYDNIKAIRRLVGNRQFSCYLRFRDCSCSFGNISSFTIQHIVKMDRIGTSIALVTGFIYMNLVATVWLFISMIPSEVILTIFIWPNWNTDFLDCLATTWNISYDNIKTIRALVGNRQFSCYLRFRDCGCSFGNISSFTIQHIVKMHRISTSVTLMASCIYMNLIATVWLFVSMIPSEIILTIFIWPNWNTDFLNCLATTWNIGYDNIKAIRGLVVDGKVTRNTVFLWFRLSSFQGRNIHITTCTTVTDVRNPLMVIRSQDLVIVHFVAFFQGIKCFCRSFRFVFNIQATCHIISTTCWKLFSTSSFWFCLISLCWFNSWCFSFSRCQSRNICIIANIVITKVRNPLVIIRSQNFVIDNMVTLTENKSRFEVCFWFFLNICVTCKVESSCRWDVQSPCCGLSAIRRFAIPITTITITTTSCHWFHWRITTHARVWFVANPLVAVSRHDLIVKDAVSWIYIKFSLGRHLGLILNLCTFLVDISSLTWKVAVCSCSWLAHQTSVDSRSHHTRYIKISIFFS